MTSMTRVNRDGHPCPPWCASDHDEELAPGHFYVTHSTDHALVLLGEYDRVRVSGVLFPSDGKGAVHVSGGDAPLFVDPKHAEGLAALADLLAGATPEQHRALAAAIRQAAETITQPG